MNSRATAGLAASLLLAAAAPADPLRVEEERARIGSLFEMDAAEAQGLRVAVDAIETGPDGRLQWLELEGALAGILAARGVPRIAGEAGVDDLALSCRVALAELPADDSGWSQVRWDGTCDLSRRGRIGIATARAGGASHPDAFTARQRARDAARQSLVDALEQRLEALPQAPPQSDQED